MKNSRGNQRVDVLARNQRNEKQSRTENRTFYKLLILKPEARCNAIYI